MRVSSATRRVYIMTMMAAMLAAIFSQGCGRQTGGTDGQKVTLILGGYTTPREAYGKAIIPAFQKYWKEKTGQEVVFQESYQGGAQWNINAIYGAALRGYAGVKQGDAAAAQAFLRDVFRNVSILDKGARESITNYEKGVGDVAITYENEVLVGRQAGQNYDYVVPRSTILIENPVAVVDENVDKHGVRQVAEAFVNFLWDKEAQRAYAKYGLRPVDPDVAGEVQSQYPAVEDLWKIDFLGGWAKVTQDIYGQQGIFSSS